MALSYWCSKHQRSIWKTQALFYYIQGEGRHLDIWRQLGSPKTLQLTQKQSRWMNNAIGKRNWTELSLESKTPAWSYTAESSPPYTQKPHLLKKYLLSLSPLLNHIPCPISSSSTLIATLLSRSTAPIPLIPFAATTRYCKNTLSLTGSFSIFFSIFDPRIGVYFSSNSLCIPYRI